MITIYYKPAVTTFVNTNSERHFLSVIATATILRREVGRHSFKSPSGTFSLDFDHLEKGSPGQVSNGLCKFGILQESLDAQVFNRDGVKASHHISRRLVMKVFASASNFQVSQRNFRSLLATPIRSAFLATQSLLLALEFLLCFLQGARIINLFASRKNSKALDADINTRALACRGKRLRSRYLRNKQNIPTVSAASDPQLLDLAFKRARQPHTARADRRDGELIAFEWTGALRFNLQRESMIAIDAFETGKAGFLASLFDAPEEGFISRIYSLKGIGLNRSDMRFDLWQCARLSQMARLLDVVQALARCFIAINSLLKCSVVDLPRMLKFSLANLFELAVHPELVLEGFDRGIFAISHRVVNPSVDCRWSGPVESLHFQLARTFQPTR